MNGCLLLELRGQSGRAESGFGKRAGTPAYHSKALTRVSESLRIVECGGGGKPRYKIVVRCSERTLTIHSSQDSKPLGTALMTQPGPFSFTAIGHVETPFDEKFGVPRQPGLVVEAKGRVILDDPYNDPAALKGLEGFSHLWIVFVFHLIENTAEFRPTVRPPRLGGEERRGVFATRSGFRPNPIGLSLVSIESLDAETGELIVSGVDLVNGTPILDLKPYLPWAESVPEALAGFAPEPPVSIEQVEVDDLAVQDLMSLRPETAEEDLGLLRRVVSSDPRPAWDRKKSEPQAFAARMLGCDVHWEVTPERAVLKRVLPLNPQPPEKSS